METKINEHGNKPSKIIRGMASNTIKHAYLLFRTYLDMFIDFLFSLIWEGSKTAVPALDKRQSILKLGAVELARLIRNKELKSEELMLATIERIKAVNPIINAVTDERFEAALEDARTVDQKIADGLPEEYFKDKPFLGVPFTAKDSHAVGGMGHTLGLVSRKWLRAEEDAECVRLLRAAGAIPVAVTNVPEANKWQETRNMLFGQTNNPYHSGRTAGGSSGGEASLHAALGSPISLCSDIGGSTRMPAFYCGLFGYNPTAGYTSLKGSLLRTGLAPTMAAIGFVSKKCEDLAPLTKIVAGDKAGCLNLDEHVDFNKIKFYYLETAKDLRVSPIYDDMRKAMSKVITHLTGEVKSSDLAPEPYYHEGFNYMYSLWRYAMTKEEGEFAKILTNNKGEANGLLELGKKLIGQSEYSLAAILKLLDDQVLPRVNKDWAEKLIKEFQDDLANKLGENGVLILPSAPAPAPYHYSAFLRPYNFAYWAILNVLKVPAVQVPLGLCDSGVCVGVQVCAGRHRDALCIKVAQHLENTIGRYVPPCKID